MGLRLFFLTNFLGATFIQGGTFIPDSRVENVQTVKKQEGPYQNLYAHLLGLKKMVPFLADPTVGNCWEKCQIRSSISTLWGLQQPLFKKKEGRVRQLRLWNFKLGDIILVEHNNLMFKGNFEMQQWQVIQWQAWKNLEFWTFKWKLTITCRRKRLI